LAQQLVLLLQEPLPYPLMRQQVQEQVALQAALLLVQQVVLLA
jgi:hypothetical protein